MKQNKEEVKDIKTIMTCLSCKYCKESEKSFHPSTKELFRCGCVKHGKTIDWLNDKEDNEHCYCAYYNKREPVEQLSIFR